MTDGREHMQMNSMKILVTGAASGMGRHFCLRLAEAGAMVAAADVNEDGLASLVIEGGGRIKAYTLNVADEENVKDVVATASNDLGGLNGLINNAGIFRDGLLVRQDRETGAVKTMSLKNWQQVIDVDLTGPFLCTREFAAKHVETNGTSAVVINISSIARDGNMGQGNYSAAKAGLIADTVAWAKELSRYGIRFGAIAPGFVDTPILQGMKQEVLDKMLKAVPLRRVGSPDEIFAGVRFMIECDYFTGRCIDIDGGMRL